MLNMFNSVLILTFVKSFYFIGFISSFEVGKINYALDYLEEYGFLIRDKLRDVFSILKAFLLFRKFCHFKPTGQFNQETLDQMNTKMWQQRY